MACLTAGTSGLALGWDSPSKGQFPVLLLCCLERSRFLCHAMLKLRRATNGRLVGRWCRTVGATVLWCRIEHPADLTKQRPLAFESADSTLVCNHHDDTSQASEMTTVEKKILLCVALPSPGFLGKSAAMITPGHPRRMHRMHST